jgi:preprotein translocase subunit YajC
MSITSIIMLVVLAALIFFMFRNSRKRSRDQAALRDKMQPGAEIMTNFGLYGKLLSIDEEDNTALVETTPGTIVKVHRQALSRVVEPTESPVVEEAQAPVLNPESSAKPISEPEYGERVDGTHVKPKDE